MDIPSSIFVMAGAIAAAFITGVFSFVNLIISKEQKVSEFRQNWIDTLRIEISGFLSGIETLSRIAEAAIKANGKEEFTEKELSQFRKDHKEELSRLSEMHHRVLLRLNPSEHQGLKGLFDSLVEVFYGTCRFSEQVYELKDNIVVETQKILKNEWKRVKNGERIFRITKIAAIIFLILALWISWKLKDYLYQLASN